MSIASQRPRFDEEDDEPKAPPPRQEDALAERFLKTRTILLSGEIDKESSERFIRQLLLLESLSADPITVLIDSPGGDVDAGYAIFDMIRFVSAPVRIVGMGLVASAAALVLLAVPKDRRLGLPNSHYLIHQPLSGIRGVATEIEIHARELEKTRERVNRVIAEETGQSMDRVRKDTDRDFWMNAEEAIAYGLISRVAADALGPRRMTRARSRLALGRVFASLDEAAAGDWPVYRGKVRDVVRGEKALLLVASDRISAFDRVLSTVPFKGEVLSRVSAWWFERCSDIMPESCSARRRSRLARPGQGHLVAKVEMLPVEVVVRGYLAGSAWRDYQRGQGRIGHRPASGSVQERALSRPPRHSVD